MALNRGCTYRIQAGPDAAGLTVRAYLGRTYRHSSDAEWAARLDCGEVSLAGVVATGGEVLRPGQVVEWRRPSWNEPDVPLHVEVLFEDASLLAVHKPAGLPTMPAGGFLEHTLLRQVQAERPEAHALHRLGRFTSGVVLFARTTDAASRLAADWRAHRVRKVYLALGQGVPTWASRRILVPIGPVPHPRLGEVYAASGSGKPADTMARVLEIRDDQTLFDVQIATGRPHQIRVHLAAVGHPLVGDPLYTTGGVPHAQSPGLPGDGGYLLHAHRLEVTHPVTGAPLAIEAPPPAELVLMG
ncbi:MAG: RluA family pseudouridine synthase [Acidobacteriota bacterium]|nr:RluA family pseudouridine synthase [Acidobacteriota bacterium]